MLLGHLEGSLGIVTQFSPWAASIQTALSFGLSKEYDVFVSITETRKLAHTNFIAHVPSLRSLDKSFEVQHWEYLVHGVNSGLPHEAVPLRAFLDVDIPKTFSQLAKPFDGSSPCFTITKHEITKARRVADEHGGSSIHPITVAILCQTKRVELCWRNRPILNLSLVVEPLKDCDIPEDRLSDAGISIDEVDAFGYGDVEHMIWLLRALIKYYRGEELAYRQDLSLSHCRGLTE